MRKSLQRDDPCDSVGEKVTLSNPGTSYLEFDGTTLIDVARCKGAARQNLCTYKAINLSALLASRPFQLKGAGGGLKSLH